jgi:hypothetical protein
MSDHSVSVVFGGNASELEAAAAQANAALKQAVAQMQQLAREQAKAGESADQELGAKMLSAATKVAEFRKSARDANEELKAFNSGGSLGEVAKGIGEIEHAASGHGTGIGFYMREVHALGDELSSGRTRQAEGTFLNLTFTFLQGHAALIPYVAAAAAVAAALGAAAYAAYEASAAVRSIELDAAANQFRLSGDAARGLRDSIEQLASVSASDAALIAKPFLELGPVGAIVAQLAAVHMPALAEQMGTNVGDAAQKVAERFVDLEGAGRKFVESSRLATAEQRASYAAFVAAGDRIHAYRVVLDIVGESLAAVEQKQRAQNAATLEGNTAIQIAAQSEGNFETTQKLVAEAIVEANAKIDAQTSKLSALAAQLLATSMATEHFRQGMEEALKVDKVAANIRDTQGEIGKLEAGIAAAGDKSSPAINEMSKAAEMLRDRLKKLREQSDDGLLGRDAWQQLEAANKGIADTYKGPEAGLIRQQRDADSAFAADPSHSAAERQAAQEAANEKSKQLIAAEYQEFQHGEQMKLAAASKNSSEIIAVHQQMVARAVADYGKGSKEAEAQELALAEAIKSARESGSKSADKAAKDSLGATAAGLSEEIAHVEAHTAAYLEHLNAEVKLKQITEQQKLGLALDAIKKESAEVGALYGRELALAGLSLTKKQEIADKEIAFQDATTKKIAELQDHAAEAAQKSWDTATKQINSAFDSQIGGLLRGTTTWGQAFKNVLSSLTDDLLKFAVNSSLTFAETNAKQMLGFQSQVAAHVAGSATMAAADQTAGAAGLAATLGGVMKVIDSFAAETFAGVTAFMAPIAGPAAPGFGAAAAASVTAAGAVASADIGMWSVPADMLTMVHHNELIMPAAESGAFRSMLSNASANDGSSGKSGASGGDNHVHFHVNAIDRAGVKDFFHDNGEHIMSSINHQVGSGGHLPFRNLK